MDILQADINSDVDFDMDDGLPVRGRQPGLPSIRKKQDDDDASLDTPPKKKPKHAPRSRTTSERPSPSRSKSTTAKSSASLADEGVAATDAESVLQPAGSHAEASALLSSSIGLELTDSSDDDVLPDVGSLFAEVPKKQTKKRQNKRECSETGSTEEHDHAPFVAATRDPR
jgi:hypothetical protein